MGLSLQQIDTVLEDLYLADTTIPELVYTKSPMLAMIEHKGTGGGRQRHVQLRNALPQGASATFADAQANATGSSRVGFDVPWRQTYQTAELDGNVLRDPAGNKTIAIDHLESEMNGTIETIRRDLSRSVFRDRGGARGQRASVSGSVVTLVDPEDSVFIEVGMVLQASATDGLSGTPRVGEIVVTKVDRTAGAFTFTGTITGFANNDYLFADGDFGLKKDGFNGYITAAAPTATLFNGVDRSVDPERLAGIRGNHTGTIVQRIKRLATLISRYNQGSADIFCVNPLQWEALEFALEGRKDVMDTVQGKGAAASIGFDAIKVATGDGLKRVIADPSCQADVVWGIDTSSWCFETVGSEMIRVLDDDGLKIRAKASSDAYEVRMQTRGNFWCKAPGANGRAALAGVTNS